MAYFTVRVELHNANGGHYVLLHQKMEAEGFSRSLTANGTVYELPTAEYVISAALTGQQIMAKAQGAAAQVVTSHGVLVAETTNWLFSGLKKTT